MTLPITSYYLSKMSSIVGNVKQKRDAHLIQQFSKPSCSDSANSSNTNHSKSHKHTDSQALDTIETEISSIIKQPLSERAKSFYDKEKSDQITTLLNSTKPWIKDANYFQHVYVSSLALVKMTVHARSGGLIEVMGMLTGKIIKNGIVVMDIYPLPVEGTETRVNAQAEGYEFMVQYLDTLKKTGRYENIVGWYHSHPGYGCWLSGIDVSTQSLNQQFQDPYLAIVVDPERTISNGSVEIGAFRTYPDHYHNKNGNSNHFESLGSLVNSPAVKKKNNKNDKKMTTKVSEDIPEEKIKDFGLHNSKYYSLSIEIFRSDLDQSILGSLWSKFWISSLSTEEETVDSTKTEKFIQEKLIEFNNKVVNLKKFDHKTVQVASTEGVTSASFLGKATGQVSGFLRRARFTESSNIASTSSSPNNFSLLSQSQLSPFTKANILSKMKAKETDTDGSDSEMNDIDSDTDSRIDVDEQSLPIAQRLESPRPNGQINRRTRKVLNQSAAKTEDTNATLPESATLTSYSQGTETSQTYIQRYGNSEIEDRVAQASRNLMSLKLQEILFLNE